MTCRTNDRPAAATPAPRAAVSNAIEQLERRTLLAAFIANHTLFVIGTGHSDVINLSIDGPATIVTVNSAQRSFDNSRFDRIDIDARNGNDSVAVSDEITKPATIRGGRGDDALKGGGGDDVLVAGLGNDTLDGGGTYEQHGGMDTADYSQRRDDITITGYDIMFASGEADTYHHVETLVTGSGDDSIGPITGSSTDPRYVDAGPGNDRVELTTTYGYDATAHGGAGNDDILIRAFYYTGVYFGDAGDDIFRVSRSSRTDRDFHGGPGIDTVDFTGFMNEFHPVTVSIDNIANDGSPTEQFPAGSPPQDNVHSDVERIVGTSGPDTMVGSDRHETFIGNGGRDTIDGAGGNDLIYGAGPIGFGYYNDYDSLLGGGGNDTLNPGEADDTVDGGEGLDTLNYAARTESIVGGGLQIAIAPGEIDLYGQVETLLCGNGDDSIGIDGNQDSIRLIDGGRGNDDLRYGDHYLASGTAPTLRGGSGNDLLKIDRFGGNDVSGGFAYYFGDAGDDLLDFSRIRTDRDFNGGTGIDTVNYGPFTTAGGLSVTLDDQRDDGPYGGDSVHGDVDVVYATSFDCTLVGNAGEQTLIGSNGDDFIDGRGGDDYLEGGPGNDTIRGGPGNDTLIGGPGDDDLDGGPGMNLIIDDFQVIPSEDESLQLVAALLGGDAEG